MDLTAIYCHIAVVLFYSAVGSIDVSDDRDKKNVCHDLRYKIQNCTTSPNYRLLDNMPIILNATEISLFCRKKDTMLNCLKKTLDQCEDKLTGGVAILYDYSIFNTTYNTLCDNMELTWWSETSCILQLDTKLQNCRLQKHRLLAAVQNTGSSDLYCQNLEDLYTCNTYQTDRTCQQKYSEYLTTFYRRMLTPSMCQKDVDVDKVRYKTATDDLSTTNHSVSDTACLGLFVSLRLLSVLYLTVFVVQRC